MQLSGYPGRYDTSLRLTCLQAREFSPSVRYYLVINKEFVRLPHGEIPGRLNQYPEGEMT